MGNEMYNEDELQHPTWMDADFFKGVMEQHEQVKNVQIVGMDVKPASMKGDHYASVMFRVRLQYAIDEKGENKKITLIVKTVPDEAGMKRDMLQEAPLFLTEIDMYTKTLSEIEAILAEHGDKTKFGPNVIYHSMTPNKVIIMEDLCEMGYDCVRGRYLSEVEMRLVYRHLAKLHAVSFMVGKSENHESVTKYQAGIFSNSLVTKNELISGGITKFIKMLSAHDEFQLYVPKVKAMEEELFDKCKALYCSYANGAKDDIFVLNHGDFHMKNLMFKFGEEGETPEVKFVDFQISVFAPSAVDLIYSSFMALSPDLQRDSTDSIFHDYFEAFIGTLKKIGYEGQIPAYADFQMSRLRHRHFALFMLSTFLPLVCAFIAAKPEDLTENSNVIEDPEKLGEIYQNPRFIEQVKNLLPKMLERGFLD